MLAGSVSHLLLIKDKKINNFFSSSSSTIDFSSGDPSSAALYNTADSNAKIQIGSFCAPHAVFCAARVQCEAESPSHDARSENNDGNSLGGGYHRGVGEGDGGRC